MAIRNQFGYSTPAVSRALARPGFENPYRTPIAAAPRATPIRSAPAPVKALSTPGVNTTQTTAAPPPTAASVNTYDITTDPALQAITALTGRSDEEARSAALKQQQGQLLAYGDPTLAASVLNDPTIAQAAGQNPTSTLAQLRQARTRNVGQLTEDLNKQNLFYGGYRVTQEQQAAQDYQNQLAKAAGAVGGNLDTIQGNLAAALGANQAQRIQAMMAAYAANPAGYTTGGGYPGGGYMSGGELPPGTLSPGNYGAAPTMTDTTGLSPADAIAAAAAKNAAYSAWTTQYNDPNVARLAAALGAGLNVKQT